MKAASDGGYMETNQVKAAREVKKEHVPHKIAALADRVFTSPWTAYFSILAFQLWRLGLMWSYKDLTYGDTSAYFYGAVRWHQNFQVNIAWSPLYTAYYGTFLWATEDAYAVTISHRILIVCVVTLLLLAVLRETVPPTFAWLGASWWAAKPINFDTLYEVHLFAAIPLLTALLCLQKNPRGWGRPLCLGVLSVTVLLVRNEYVIAAAVYLGYLMVRRWRAVRGGEIAKRHMRNGLYKYVLILALAALSVLGTYWRSVEKFPALSNLIDAKHTLNLCQIYAFGYQQRNPAYHDSPWTECEPLMRDTFGRPLLPMTHAILANPKAMLTHFLWNVSLIPAGFEVLMFNATGFKTNPDYAPVQRRSWAHWAAGLMMMNFLVGLWMIRKGWQTRWRERVAGWSDPIALWLGLALTSAVVMITQRPRPSYLLVLEAGLIVLCMISILAVVESWHLLPMAERLGPWVILLVFATVPPFFRAATPLPPRTLYSSYQRLWPHRDIFLSPTPTSLLATVYPFELCSYIARQRHRCVASDYYALRQKMRPGADIGTLLKSIDATVVYLDEPAITEPFVKPLLDAPWEFGWRTVASNAPLGQPWALLRRVSPPETPVYTFSGNY